MTTVGFVLAGGRASRMGGGDKPLLALGGGTVLDAVLARVRAQVAAVAIGANGDAARFARFGLPVVADGAAGAGPLAGVLAGLAWAEAVGAGGLLTVPGDTPFLPRDLVARLGAAPAWASSDGAVHPLVAVWPVAARGALEAWLREGRSLRVRAFGGAIGMRDVPFADAGDAFLNINTPEDLSRARRLEM